jgi:hypothetical protein
MTPAFTATPIPSETPTPSITPIPTETLLAASLTPTLAPTATATVSGVISSNQNVNIRSGPNGDVVGSMPPGTEFGVLSIETDERGFAWYQISYLNEDDEIALGWVRANLVLTDFNEATAGSSAAPASTTETDGTVERTPGPSPVPDSKNVLAYCSQRGVRPPTINTNDSVYIWWSWYATREDLMPQHLEHATYTVRLDGQLLENWEDYTSELKPESGLYYTYWYYPVGPLSAGQHTVTYLLSWDEQITDGRDQFGPGTNQEVNEGSCEFTVVEP